MMGLAAPAFSQSPPPPDPDGAGHLIVTVTHPAKDKLTVTTPGWKAGEDIPFKYTQYQGNTFPGLEWSKGPASTKSYAIIMQDSAMAMRVFIWYIARVSCAVTPPSSTGQTLGIFFPASTVPLGKNR